MNNENLKQDAPKVYVVMAEVNGRDENTSDIIGIFNDRETAMKIAKTEIDDAYAYDLEDKFDNDESSLEFKTLSYGYRYYDPYDYYSVEVSVYEKPMNVRDIIFVASPSL